jgi:hypothetical protein
MALGEPREQRRIMIAAGERTVWTYSGLIVEPDDGKTLFRTTNDLIWGSPFRRQAYDFLQVVFTDGEVTGMQAYPRNP